MLRDSLECVLIVSKHNSFAKAAKELFLSTPAITQRINALEDELGFKIFIRSNKGAFLTAAGEAFVKDAEKLLSDLDDTIDRCRSISNKEKSHLTIGVYDILNYYLMPRVCKFFRDKRPDVLLSFVDVKDFTNPLLQGLADIVIPFGNVGVAVPNLTNTTLIVDECVCYLSVNHRLADNKYIRLQDILEERIIMPPLETSEYHRNLYSTLMKSSASLHVDFVNSYGVGALKAMMNDSIVFCPKSFHLESEDMISIPFESFPFISIDAITREEPQGLIKEFIYTAEYVLRSMNDLVL